MNITRVICAGVLLLAGSAAAQDGGKPILKTTISLGTATPERNSSMKNRKRESCTSGTVGGGFPLSGAHHPSAFVLLARKTGRYRALRGLRNERRWH